jgi:hypothetical protein
MEFDEFCPQHLAGRTKLPGAPAPSMLKSGRNQPEFLLGGGGGRNQLESHPGGDDHQAERRGRRDYYRRVREHGGSCRARGGGKCWARSGKGDEEEG